MTAEAPDPGLKGPPHFVHFRTLNGHRSKTIQQVETDVTDASTGLDHKVQIQTVAPGEAKQAPVSTAPLGEVQHFSCTATFVGRGKLRAVFPPLTNNCYMRIECATVFFDPNEVLTVWAHYKDANGADKLDHAVGQPCP